MVRSLNLISLPEASDLSVTFKEKIPKQYFSVVLFIMLNKVVLTLETVNEIVKCDHAN